MVADFGSRAVDLGFLVWGEGVSEEMIWGDSRKSLC